MTEHGAVHLDHWIDNLRYPDLGKDVHTIRSPLTEAPLGTISVGSQQAVDAAVSSSERAFRTWSHLSIAERAEHLMAAQERILEHVDDITALEVAEVGHAVVQAREWIVASLRQIERFVKAAEDLPARAIEAHAQVVRDPYGPTAIITPWNYPILIVMRSLPAVLLMGNTVVVKPSERSPLSTDALITALGLPDGVVNLIHGDSRSGAPLVDDPRIRLVIHTGSVNSGVNIAAASARHLRPVILELGGKDPVIVDAGVDLDWAAGMVAEGAFLNTGQVCTSMERIYVHADVIEEFSDRLVAHAQAVVVGAGDDPATTMGPLIDQRQREIVHAQVSEAVARGARVLTGGTIPDGVGFFYPPTILRDVTQEMQIMRDETFGPVAPIKSFSSFDEAIALANDTDFGLTATVLTADPEHRELAQGIRAGVVWINEWHTSAPGDRHEPRGRSGLGAVGDAVGVLEAVSSPKLVKGDAAAAPTPRA